MVEPITLQTLLTYLSLISIRARIKGINPMVDVPFLSWEYRDYDDFMSKYGPESNSEGYDNLMGWFRMLEEMGVYVKEGLLDIRLIYLLHGGTISKSWELLEVLMDERRIRTNMSRWFIEAEYLCKKIIEYGEKHPELAT